MIDYLWHRYRPHTGWLPLILLLTLAGCLIASTQAARWTPDRNGLVVMGLGGLALGLVLAKRPLPWRTTWLLITLYGLTMGIIWLAHLLPPWAMWANGQAIPPYWRQQGALFLDRLGGWWRTILANQSSQETLPLSLLIGLALWLLLAFLAWSSLRHFRPLPGLTLMGLLLALNSYLRHAPLHWLTIFIALAALFISLIHDAHRQQVWQQRQVDYSPEIQFDLTLYAGSLALALMALSIFLPGLNFTRLRDALLRQPIIQELDQSWQRSVGRGGRSEQSPSAPGGSGVLPRAFLLGHAPELAKTVMMTAVLEIRDPNGSWIPVTDDPGAGLHWRGLSYETYTGRGWTLSAESQENFPPHTPIPQPPMNAARLLRQRVTWQYDTRSIRYTVGWPQSFDQEVMVLWRGLTDLVRVQGSQPHYQVISRLPTAEAAALRTARLSDVPAALLARYTALPADLPQRVRDMAQEVAGRQPTPYDQAVALQTFLRQYPYSLDVAAPPAGVDAVDYFLFTAQQGYCDFYASAMTVLARSLGLPARVATGFLAQPPDRYGVQTIYQIHSHSWAEVYFAGYGWVEFEPTAGFALDQGPDGAMAAEAMATPTAVPPLPPADEARPSLLASLFRGWGGWLGGLGLLLGGGWWMARRRRQIMPPTVWTVYGRLQHQATRLGAEVAPQQTPAEFQAALVARLGRWPHTDQLVAPIAWLTAAFTAVQYSPDKEVDGVMVQHTWQLVRRPLWWLRWRGPRPQSDDDATPEAK